MAEKKVVEKWDGVERRNKKPKPIPTGPDIYLGGDGLPCLLYTSPSPRDS